MSAPRLTAEQKAAMMERYRRGDALTEIARRTRVHESYPTILARRRGVSRGPQEQEARR